MSPSGLGREHRVSAKRRRCQRVVSSNKRKPNNPIPKILDPAGTAITHLKIKADPAGADLKCLIGHGI